MRMGNDGCDHGFQRVANACGVTTHAWVQGVGRRVS